MQGIPRNYNALNMHACYRLYVARSSYTAIFVYPVLSEYRQVINLKVVYLVVCHRC